MPSRTEKVIEQKIKANSEITINLVLTIKLDGSNFSVSAQQVGEEPAKPIKKMKTIDIDDELFIPDIPTGGMIDFGNKIKED